MKPSTSASFLAILSLCLLFEGISAVGLLVASKLPVSKSGQSQASQQPQISYESESELSSKAAPISSSTVPTTSTTSAATSSSTTTTTERSLGQSASVSAAAASLAPRGELELDETDEPEEDEPRRVVAPPSGHSGNMQLAASSDLKTAAGYHYPSHHGADHHHGGHHYGKYYQYASVPYPHAWEFGYRRGNPYHTIERHEKGKGPHFHTKVKWQDKYGGYGVHVWDYNHDDHHGSHYGGHDSHDSHYGHAGGSGHHGSHYGHH